MSKEKTSYLGIRVPADLKDRLDTVCKKRDRSMSYICRELLEKSIKKNVK